MSLPLLRHPFARHILSAVVAVSALSACGGGKQKLTEVPSSTVAMTVSGSGAGSGRVVSVPAGIDCTLAAGNTTGTCQARFAQGSLVMLNSQPAATSVFLAFSGDCAAAPCLTTMEAPRTVTATFVPNFLTVVANSGSVGGGRVVSTPAGIDCTLSGTAAGTGVCSASFPVGTSVTLTQEAIGGASFGAWNGACTGDPCTVTMSGQRTVDVTYRVVAATPPPTLTVAVGAGSRGSGIVTSAPSGINCSISGTTSAGTCSTTFPVGTVVSLTQTPTGNTVFQAWGADCLGNPCQLTMSQARVANVTYQIPPDGVISVSGTGTGLGSVSSSPAGISCTITAGVSSGICTASFEAGTSVTLTATGGNNGSFDGFTGACTGGACVLPVVSNVTSAVSAGFTAAPQRLTVAAGPGSAGSGVITSSPAGINCVLNGTTTSGTCTAFYTANTLVTLSQTPAGNALFRQWSGDCSLEPCQVVMSQSRTALAAFQTQIISVTGGGTGNGIITSVPSGIACTITAGVITGTCTATFAANTSVALNATPSGLSSFTGFTGACAGATCTVAALTGVTNSVTAQFTAPPTLAVTAGTGSQGGGTITTTPAGVSCTLSNSATSGTCVSAYAINSSVTVTQVPTNGSVFVNWTGACTGSGSCVVPMSSNKALQAVYRLAVPGAVTVNAGAGSGNGSVSSSPGGLACSITNQTKSGICRAIFPVGSTVSLIATPAAGYRFSGFSGSCSGTTCVMTVPENGDITVTATFIP